MQWQHAILCHGIHQVCESLARGLQAIRAAAHRIKRVVIKVLPCLLHRSHYVLVTAAVSCLIWVDLHHLPSHAFSRSEASQKLLRQDASRLQESRKDKHMMCGS